MADMTNEQAARLIESTILAGIQRSFFELQMCAIRVAADQQRSQTQRDIIMEQRQEFINEFERLREKYG